MSETPKKDFGSLSDAELSALAAETRDALAALDLSDASDDVLAQADDLACTAECARAEMDRRAEAAALVASAPAVVTAPAASPAAPSRGEIPIFASADVPGWAVGASMSTSQVAEAIVRRASSLPKVSGRAGKFYNKYNVASIRREVDPRAVVDGPGTADAAIKFAVDQSRLSGGSLVAAGGWCAPSETLYELCELETTGGLISLPEIVANRGGFNHTMGPNFADIFAESGFCFTESQDEAGDYDPDTGGDQPKPCYTVDCPDFTDVRLETCGICVSAGYLQNRAYPELTDRTVRGVLVAHQHRIAANIIADMVAASTAVTFPTVDANPGAAAPILEAVELQAMHLRYTQRMQPDATLEAIFPVWVKAAIRADLSRRLGVDLLSVPDARVVGWFRERGINPQFVYNWQDFTGAATGRTAWPTTVQFMLYAAGTFVRASADVIDLGVVHDSSKFAFNNYTAAFAEEGYAVLERCPGAVVVTVPFCASGATAGGLELVCGGS